MKLKRIFKEEQKEFSKIDSKDDLIEFDILSRVPLEIMKKDCDIENYLLQ